MVELMMSWVYVRGDRSYLHFYNSITKGKTHFLSKDIDVNVYGAII